jgi:hypothetical protein
LNLTSGISIFCTVGVWFNKRRVTMGGHYHIQCEDLETFLKVVLSLMKAGAYFESYTDDLTIKLTGGY